MKKAKKTKKKPSKTKSARKPTYTTWEKSLRTNVKSTPTRSKVPKKPKKTPKSAAVRKGKTVKKKMKSRKTKSSKLKKKKPQKKKKAKKKAKPKEPSSFISDFSSEKLPNLQQKISDLQIENQQLKKTDLRQVKSFNFVYQADKATRDSAGEAYRPPVNPFQMGVKLPMNSGQQSDNGLFGVKATRLLSNGRAADWQTFRGDRASRSKSS